MGRAGSGCADRGDRPVAMAALGDGIMTPLTPALFDGASAAMALIPVIKCRCDGSKRV